MKQLLTPTYLPGNFHKKKKFTANVECFVFFLFSQTGQNRRLYTKMPLSIHTIYKSEVEFEKNSAKKEVIKHHKR